MLGDPEVVVLDEPANGLDPEGVSWVRRILRHWADEGRTMLVASHVLAEIGQVVDRVVIIRAGRLVAETGLAARAGVTVTELAKQSTGDSLEALFLDVIGGNGQ
jgi:ABC-2 type transport system ATP-binding protein